MQANGYEHCSLPSNLFTQDIFCAGSDTMRLQFFMDALLNASVDIIWCVRGGYGAARLISALQDHITTLKKIPKKLFIGFSDTTVMHIFLNQSLGWHTIHALNYNQISMTAIGHEFAATNLSDTIDIIQQLKRPHIVCDDLILTNHIAPKNSIHGALIGGNLSLLQTSIGTSWEIQTTDKILILEDIKEEPYKVDRMMEHLLQSGKFNSIKALIIGHFHQCSLEIELTFNRISAILEKKSIPVYKTIQIGHGYYNSPFIFGAQATISQHNKHYILKQNND